MTLSYVTLVGHPTDPGTIPRMTTHNPLPPADRATGADGGIINGRTSFKHMFVHSLWVSTTEQTGSVGAGFSGGQGPPEFSAPCDLPMQSHTTNTTGNEVHEGQTEQTLGGYLLSFLCLRRGVCQDASEARHKRLSPRFPLKFQIWSIDKI